jgi:N-acetylmuramoyl-L-alanine amidase
MHKRTNSLITLTSLVLAVAGCRAPQRRAPVKPVAEHTVTIEALAVRLGLRITERDATFVVLKDKANTVLLFTHAEGRFFVNGRVIGPVGTVRTAGGTVEVPESLVSAIRPHLDTAGPQPTPVPPRPGTAAVVVIDPGHGGRDPGATSRYGTHEKDINLPVARRIATLLAQRGVTVAMTRRQDRFIELEDRAGLANRRGADLFVSIHADSAPDPSASGFTLYVATDASPKAYEAARAIERAMATTGSGSRGIRKADYRVLVQTKGPAVLIELGYLSNAADARRLHETAFQNRLARAIADGILRCLR